MINKVILQGRLTKDPELRHTQSGTAVASFTIAWSEKRGEQETKLFLPCVAWSGTAEFICRNFKKGSALAVEGKLTTRNWTDKDGNNRSSIELTVSDVHFTEGKKEEASAPHIEPSAPAPFAGFSELAEDEDMPF